MKRLLVIDALNLLFRNYIVNPSLSTNGQPIGGLKGFLQSLQKLIREIITIMRKDSLLIFPLLHIQNAAKWLERIGDHCTNLAEMVIFMINGTDMRHIGKRF